MKKSEKIAKALAKAHWTGDSKQQPTGAQTNSTPTREKVREATHRTNVPRQSKRDE
jgi:hypothetical protein